MIFWVLFAVLNAIYIAGLLWCIMAIRSTTRIGAEVLDIHTNQLRKQSAEIATLRESQFPRYTDAVVTLPAVSAYPPATTEAANDARVMTFLEDIGQATPQKAQDARVRAALEQAVPGPNAAQKLAQNAVYGKPGGWQHQPMRKPGSGGGVPMADPESAPFFTQSQPEK